MILLILSNLFVGSVGGQYLGGPWTVIAPAAGFGVGLVGDMKFMHKMHKPLPKKTEEDETDDTQPILKFRE